MKNKQSSLRKIAVYPGSFDPITIGHLDIIERVSQVFDEVIVLVAASDHKAYMFSNKERMNFIKKVISNGTFKSENITVDSFDGLTTEYMKKKKAHVIVRGLRAVADFEYEGTLANMNKRLSPEIETFMIFSKPEYYFISSRGVKEIARNRGPLKGLVPDFIIPALEKKLK
jgi:pantetheine-phosphate adenylyltransferase